MFYGVFLNNIQHAKVMHCVDTMTLSGLTDDFSFKHFLTFQNLET